MLLPDRHLIGVLTENIWSKVCLLHMSSLFLPILSQCQSKGEGSSQLQTLAVSSFDLPGDPGFPLNAFYEKPANRADAGGTLVTSHHPV